MQTVVRAVAVRFLGEHLKALDEACFPNAWIPSLALKRKSLKTCNRIARQLSELFLELVQV